MPNKTISRIKERKSAQARAAKAGRAAAEARGAPSKKVVPKPEAPKKKVVRKKTVRRAPTPAQKVRSISGGDTRTKAIKELRRKIRELEKGE